MTAAADPFCERGDERERMVAMQLAARGVLDARVLAALRRVPRHAFVDPELAAAAYDDRPLPIGRGQTISQPYVVARTCEAAEIAPGDKVLEVGTGCGYQTAILCELGADVTALEIVPELAAEAEERLLALGYAARVLCADGSRGYPAGAPFDAIVVAAAPLRVPEALVEELAAGGRLVLPVGGDRQSLNVIKRTESGLLERVLFPVRFVPMTGGEGDVGG